jgi:hypothetical protein
MKKLKLILIILVGFTINAAAQNFAGGSVGFNYTGGKIENNGNSVDKPSRTSLNLSPFGGVFLSERLAAGLQIGYSFVSEKTPGIPDEVESTSFYGLSPFIRYYAFSLNKFHLFAQGNVGFGYGVSKYKVGSVTTSGPKTSTISLTIAPAIAYDLSDRISLEAAIGGLNFGYVYSMSKLNNTKNVTSNFAMGANLSQIINTGFLSIGAIVKF